MSGSYRLFQAWVGTKVGTAETAASEAGVAAELTALFS
jgi:hypothetical protein